MKSRYLLMSTNLIAAGVLCSTPAIALADPDRRPTDVNDPYAPVTREDTDEHVRTEVGMSVSVGGGIMNFTDGQLNDQTDPGGNWQARLTLGTRSVIALEGAYIGQASNLNGLGLDPDTLLQAHGAEGLLRLNMALDMVQPYLFVGTAWKRYSLLNNNNIVSAVADEDDVIEVPFGAGLAFRGDGFVFDTRFGYRPAYDEEMFASIGGDRVDMNNWDATARLGFEF
jgi:hypothetical protein